MIVSRGIIGWGGFCPCRDASRQLLIIALIIAVRTGIILARREIAASKKQLPDGAFQFLRAAAVGLRSFEGFTGNNPPFAYGWEAFPTPYGMFSSSNSEFSVAETWGCGLVKG